MIFPWQNSKVTASFPGPAQFLVHCLQYVCGEPGNEAKKVTQLYFFSTYIQQEVWFITWLVQCGNMGNILRPVHC